MLFNTGTTISMVAKTQQLAGSPSTAQIPLYTAAETKDAINEAYLLFVEEMRRKDAGWATKRTYTDIVAEQEFYEMPDDFMRVILLEVELDGQDLSTTDPNDTNVAFPRRENNETVFEGRSRDEIGEAGYYTIHGRHIGIFGPPETAGTKSLRLTYEASGVELSADTDEPVVPRPFHRTICRQAAVYLRADNDLPVGVHQAIADRQFGLFLKSVAEPAAGYEYQVPVAGRGVRSTYTVSGTIRHR